MGKIVSVYEHFGLRTFRFTNISVYEHFGLRTFRFTNDLQERIKFVNRGLTVYLTEVGCVIFYWIRMVGESVVGQDFA